MARCILKDLSKSLWAEAIAWSTYIKNHLPHSTISFKTPFEIFHSHPPSLDYLRSFGTPCIIHIMPEERPAGSKLLPRGKEGIICGYTESNKLYRVYLKDTHQVKVSRDVIFPNTSVGRELELSPEVLEETVSEQLEEMKFDIKTEEPIITIKPPTSTNLSNEEIPLLHQEENIEERLLKRGNVETVISTPSSSSQLRYPSRNRKSPTQYGEWSAHLATM